MAVTGVLRILSVGDDLDLLSTRTELLRLTGAQVVKCRGRDAAGVLEKEKFDLVVLCHTLPEHDAAKVVRMTGRDAAGVGTRTKVLQTTPFGAASWAKYKLEVDEVVPAVPELLVQRAASLLGVRMQVQRASGR